MDLWSYRAPVRIENLSGWFLISKTE